MKVEQPPSLRSLCQSVRKLITAIIRVFRSSGFNAPKITEKGVVFLVNCSAVMSRKIAIFPLIFNVEKQRIALKLVFSQNSAPYILQCPSLESKVSSFLELINASSTCGHWSLDPFKHIISLQTVLHLDDKADIRLDERLRTVANRALDVYRTTAEQLLLVVSRPESALPTTAPRSSSGPIPFLKVQDYAPMDESLLFLGLHSFPTPYVETDCKQLRSVREALHGGEVDSIVLWECVSIDEASESIRFLQPKDCFSLDFYITNIDPGSQPLLHSISSLIEMLNREQVYIEELYDHLYVQSGNRLRISPLHFATVAQVGKQGSYSSLWKRVCERAAKTAQRCCTALTQKELWTQLDSAWKIPVENIDNLHCISAETWHGSIGLTPVSLTDSIPSGLSSAQYASVLEQALHGNGVYGVTALCEADGEVKCWVVRERL